MDPDAALDMLVEVERGIARLHALQARLLVAVADPAPRIEEFRLLDRRPGHDEERLVRIEDVVREEVAAALRWTPATAQARIDAARLLVGPLSDTQEALAAGEITYAHARVVVESAERLSSRLAHDAVAARRFAAQCRQLQKRVLPVARRGTVSRARAAGRRAVDRIDAAGQAARREAARTTRDVWVGPETDGIAPLVAQLDALTARAILAAVGAAASARPADSRTAGERRADALADLVLDPGTGVGLTAEVQVAIPADQLTGGSPDLSGLSVLLADPAIACTLRPVVTDPAGGHVLDVGRCSYRLPAALRRLIVTRDATCRFPGCGRPAVRAQIDHADPWDDGGGSDTANLGSLCTRHHQLKTHAGWQIVESRPDGSCTWRSPAGRSYEHDPPEF